MTTHSEILCNTVHVIFNIDNLVQVYLVLIRWILYSNVKWRKTTVYLLAQSFAVLHIIEHRMMNCENWAKHTEIASIIQKPFEVRCDDTAVCDCVWIWLKTVRLTI